MLPPRVLDIGAVYGRLMHRLVEAWPQVVSRAQVIPARVSGDCMTATQGARLYRV
jgi:hypothetical protein